jgi:hypothetical protein
MAKRKGDQPNSDAGRTGNEADKIASDPGLGGPSSAGLAKIDSPDLVPPQSEQSTAAAPGAASIEPPSPVIAIVDPPKAEPVSAEPAITRLDDVRPGETIAPAGPASTKWTRMTRLTPLAATIAIAAAVGAMAGSLATTGFGAIWAGEPAARTANAGDARALKDSIARINADVVALKGAIDTSGKSSNAQLMKLGDRLDRFERAQAEPAAKLAKLAEAVDRIEHRAAPAAPPAPLAAAARDTTGSIAALAPPPQPQPPAVEPARPAGPPVLEGWVLRNVYNGAALIQGRFGMVEVEPGDNLPGLGRIENIRRQDGRWVVVTSKGLIVSR